MFGGVRDSEWTHVLVEGGGRADAAPYLGEARKLLGTVRGTAETTGLGVVLRRQALRDGTELVARMIGKVPHVTIKLQPRPSSEDERVVLDGFVVWPRNAAHLDGPFAAEQPATHPQYVLSPPSRRTRQRRWWTFAFDRFAVFWDAIRGPKDVYRRRGAVDLFPEGLRLYGNHQWRSKAGVILSWHGYESNCIATGAYPHVLVNPGSGIGASTLRAPTLPMGPYVFHFGRAILDVTDWATVLIRVLGACYRKTADGREWIYVIQGNLPLCERIACYRYALTQGLSRPGFIEAEVDPINPASRELLWEIDVPGQGASVQVGMSTARPATQHEPPLYHPIRFNQSGTKAVMYQCAGFPALAGNGASFLFSAISADDADLRTIIDIDSGALDTARLSMPVNATGRAPIAGDYVDDELIEVFYESASPSPPPVTNIGNEPHDVGSIVLGDRRILIASSSETAAMRRDIIRLDPANGLALLVRSDFSGLFLTDQRTPVVELWSASGGLLREWPCPAYNFGASGWGAFTGRVARHWYGLRQTARLRELEDGITAYPESVVQAAYPASYALRRPFCSASLSIEVYYNAAHFAETVFNPFEGYALTPSITARGAFNFPQQAIVSLAAGAAGARPEVPAPDGAITDTGGRADGFRATAIKDFVGFPCTRALLKHERYILVSCFKPGAPGESIVELVPDGDAARLTGFTPDLLRLHPAVLFGSPIFKTE